MLCRARAGVERVECGRLEIRRGWVLPVALKRQPCQCRVIAATICVRQRARTQAGIRACCCSTMIQRRGAGKRRTAAATVHAPRRERGVRVVWWQEKGHAKGVWGGRCVRGVGVNSGCGRWARGERGKWACARTQCAACVCAAPVAEGHGTGAWARSNGHHCRCIPNINIRSSLVNRQ